MASVETHRKESILVVLNVGRELWAKITLMCQPHENKQQVHKKSTLACQNPLGQKLVQYMAYVAREVYIERERVDTVECHIVMIRQQ